MLEKDELFNQFKALQQYPCIIDRSDRSKLVVTGNDRRAWLQGIISNDIELLNEQKPILPAYLLNQTGHVLADVRIIFRPDSFILDFAPNYLESVYNGLDRFIIEEHVELVDQTDFLACISVQGAGATIDLRDRLNSSSYTIVPADHTGFGGFDIYCRSEDAAPLIEKLISQEKAVLISPDAAEIMRIEAGIPEYDRDIDETTLALECDIHGDHISYEKGCYLGQEIVARIHSQGHTNRILTGFMIYGQVVPCKGDRVLSGEGDRQKEVGWVTSAVFSPMMGKTIALGFIRHEDNNADAPVWISCQSGNIAAAVVSLPFSSRSQH
jgi:aminomethyltransferase